MRQKAIAIQDEKQKRLPIILNRFSMRKHKTDFNVWTVCRKIR